GTAVIRQHRQAAPATPPVSASSASAAAPEAQRGSEYAQLSRQIKHAGLLQRRPRHYIWKIAIIAALLAAGWTAFVLVGNSWWQLAVAAFLAVMFTQVGFLGHGGGGSEERR